MVRPSGLNLKQSVISGPKKSIVIQHNAGKLFRQWGEVNIHLYTVFVLIEKYKGSLSFHQYARDLLRINK